MPRVSPLLTRLLALALLVGLVAVVWLGAVEPVVATRYDTGAQIEQTRDLLQRYRAISAGRERLEGELAHWRDEVLPRSGMFLDVSSAAAPSELQSSVSNIIKDNGGDLLSIQILPAKQEGKLQTVAVRVQFTADTGTLTDIFYDLESNRPYLFLDNLQIRTGRVERRSRIARLRGAMEQVDTLFVTGDVYGYTRGGPS